MTAKNRRELKQKFRTGAQPSAQDYADIFDSSFNAVDDGFYKPIEPHLPLRIKGNGAGLHVLDLYNDDQHTWRLSMLSGNDSGFNFGGPGGGSQFFISDATGDIGIGVTKPKGKLHINQSDGSGDALYVQDVADDVTPTRISNAGHVYINSLKDGDDNIATSDAALYVNGEFSVVNELATNKDILHINRDGDASLNGTFKLGTGVAVSNISDGLTAGTPSADNLLTENAIHKILPKGSIIMWSGTTVPAGWALCDGTNGTPDLKDRFIVGAGSKYSVGNKGGADSVALSSSQMPSHSHTGSTSSGGSHSHTGNDYQKYATSGSGQATVNNSGNTGDGKATISSTGSAHSHSFTTNSAGGGQAHENRPPYYALSFIMKVVG